MAGDDWKFEAAADEVSHVCISPLEASLSVYRRINTDRFLKENLSGVGYLLVYQKILWPCYSIWQSNLLLDATSQGG